MTAAELTKLRLTLKANGYAPIPARGKEVLLVGWPAKTDASAAEIAGWAEQHPDWSNTGILTGNVCPVDLDIRDPEAAAACEDMLRDWFDGRGSLLTRFGAAPKRAILARTAHPFSKFHVDFIAPNASKHRIEVLGTGQQIVVHGIHPGTKKPYAWHGDRQPWSTPRDELPETDEAEMQQVVQLMSDMLVEKLGFVRKEDTPAPTGNGDSSPFVTNQKLDVDACLTNMGANGADVNNTQTSAILSLLQTGTHPDDIVAKVVDATMRMADRANLGWSREVEIKKVPHAARAASNFCTRSMTPARG